MVAQIRAAPAALERQQRHHEAPADAGVGHALAELLPTGVLAAAQVIQEETHRDAAGHRALQGGEEDVGDLVPAHDVELDVDVVGGGVNGSGHGLVGAAGIGVYGHHFAADAGQAGEPAVHAQRPGQVGRGPGTLGQVGHGAGVVEGDLVDGVLLAATRAVDPRAADEQVEREPHEGQQEDEQQPGGRRRRAAVLRNRAQRGDLDEVLDDDPGGRQYRRQRHARIMSCPPTGPRKNAWARTGWSYAQALRRPAPVHHRVGPFATRSLTGSHSAAGPPSPKRPSTFPWLWPRLSGGRSVVLPSTSRSPPFSGDYDSADAV